MAEKRRLKDDKDILHRLRPFARLQTAEDFEQFQADILCTYFQVQTPITLFLSGA